MNLSELKKLKDGEKITCTGCLPKITNGKSYPIRKTKVGIFFTDDNGIGRALATNLPLEIYFNMEEH